MRKYIIFILLIFSFNIYAEKVKTEEIKNTTAISNASIEYKNCENFYNAKVGEAKQIDIFKCYIQQITSGLTSENDININNNTLSTILNTTKDLKKGVEKNEDFNKVKDFLIYLFAAVICIYIALFAFTKNKLEKNKMISKPIVVIGVSMFIPLLSVLLISIGLSWSYTLISAFNEKQMLLSNNNIQSNLDKNALIKEKLSSLVDISVNQNLNRILDNNYNSLDDFDGDERNLELILSNSDYYKCLASDNDNYSFESDRMSYRAFKTIECGSKQNKVMKTDLYKGKIYKDTQTFYNILNEQSNIIASKSLELYCAENKLGYEKSFSKTALCSNLEQKRLFKGEYNKEQYNNDFQKSYDIIYKALLFYSNDLTEIKEDLNEEQLKKIKDIRDNPLKYFVMNLIYDNDYDFKKNATILKLNTFDIEKNAVYTGNIHLVERFRKEMKYNQIEKGSISLYQNKLKDITAVNFLDKYVSNDYFFSKKILLECKGVNENEYCQLKNNIFKEIPKISSVIVAPFVANYAYNTTMLISKKARGYDQELLYKYSNSADKSLKIVYVVGFFILMIIACIVFAVISFILMAMNKFLMFVFTLYVALCLYLCGADGVWKNTKEQLEELVSDLPSSIIAFLLSLVSVSILVSLNMQIILVMVKLSNSLSTIIFTNTVPFLLIFLSLILLPFLNMHYKRVIKDVINLANELYDMNKPNDVAKKTLSKFRM